MKFLLAAIVGFALTLAHPPTAPPAQHTSIHDCYALNSITAAPDETVAQVLVLDVVPESTWLLPLTVVEPADVAECDAGCKPDKVVSMWRRHYLLASTHYTVMYVRESACADERACFEDLNRSPA